jgi:hypothetical protein
MALKFRRGTTAQQSGSLAYGEPYVNTTLGTLLIGGPDGDIVLSAGGTGSTGNFGAISGSGLDITGNANIAGNLTLGGAITIGDAAADTVNVVASLSSSLIPQTTNAFDLGSATKIWRDLYISTGSIKFVAGTTVVKELTLSTLTALETATGSSNVSITNLNSFSSSQLTKDATLATLTASYDGRFTTLGTLTGSYDTRHTTIGSYTSSLETRMTAVGTSTGSLNTSVTNINLTTASLNTSVTNLNTATSSYETKGRGIVSGSSQITYASISSIPSGIISGSSQLSGTTITNLTITNLTTVNQTASVLFSSGSNKFGDFSNDTHEFTGSVQISGSIVTIGSSTATSFNGTINSTNGVVSGSSQVIGILSSLNTYTGSNDTTNGTQNTRLTALEASASTALSTNGTQATSITNLNSATASLMIETSNLEAFSSSALTRLSNLEGKDISITLTGDVTGTGTITDLANVSFATTIAANSVALGTDTTGDYVASLVAGTNITLSNNSGEGATPTIGLTNNAITIAGTSTSLGGTISAATIGNAIGAFSGSSQVTLSSTTGYGSVINQNLLTTSNVQHASLGIGMAASGTAGRIDASNDIVAFSSSDIRFKENIKPIENALDKIRKISGNTYDWKAENKAEHGYEGNDVGVIAQEIEAVLPQLVQTRENGYKAVKYDKLVALLIEGIKDQQLQIEQLRIDLNNCRNKGL